MTLQSPSLLRLDQEKAAGSEDWVFGGRMKARPWASIQICHYLARCPNLSLNLVFGSPCLYLAAPSQQVTLLLEALPALGKESMIPLWAH